MAVVPLGLNDDPPAGVRGGVVTVGNFDGVHRGHAALLAAARELGRPVVPVTFDPHPLALLAPERYQPPLTSVPDRARLLHQAGADQVVILKTIPELLALGPEEFFDRVLRRGFRPHALVEGFNFRFGRGRAGSNELLRSLCAGAGIEFREVPALTLHGRPVSSSRAREAIVAGDVAAAAELLARPYQVHGVVGTGARRGRTIGFPTANLARVETVLPADGVYAVSVETARGTFAGAAHIGRNATFGEAARNLEVHLLDFDGDLYGQPLAVEFVARLRGTQKFQGVDALVEQMRQDVAEARRLVKPERTR